MSGVFIVVADLKLHSDGRVRILEFGLGNESNIRNKKASLAKAYEKIAAVTKLKGFETDEILMAEAGAIPGLALAKHTQPKTQFSNYDCFHKRKIDEPLIDFHDTDILTPNISPILYMAVNNKTFMHHLFEQACQLESRPKSIIIPARVYDRKLIASIQKSITSPRYVIKAATSSHGDGVIVVNQEELDVTLKLILSPDNNDFEKTKKEYQETLLKNESNENITKNIETIINFRSESTRFPSILIEEYCPSIPFQLNNEEYDATIRVVFLLSANNDDVQLEPIDCYWKLPSSSNKKSTSSLRERTISTFEYHNTTEEVSSEIFSQLKPIMVNVFKTIIQFDMQEYISRRFAPQDHEHLNQVYFILHYINYLNSLHLYNEALETIRFKENLINNLLFEHPILWMEYQADITETYLFTAQTQKAFNTITHTIHKIQEDGTFKLLADHCPERLVRVCLTKILTTDEFLNTAVPELKKQQEEARIQLMKDTLLLKELSQRMKGNKDSLTEHRDRILYTIGKRKEITKAKEAFLKLEEEVSCKMLSEVKEKVGISLPKVYTLIETLVHQRKYGSALRSIVNYNNHDIALSLSGVFFQYKRPLALNLNEVSKTTNESLLDLASKQGNQTLVARLKNEGATLMRSSSSS